MYINNNTLFALLTSGSLLLASCGGDKTEGDITIDTDSLETTMDDNNMEEETVELSFMMPSPLQVASIFKRSGLKYRDGITNPPTKASNYSSNLMKSLNFGIYASDLCYTVLNNQPQQALEYMKAIKSMSDELGMTKIMGSERLFTSFEKNIGNEDSMIAILATVQEGMDDYLQENNQQYRSAVFFAGAWLEGMYIGSEVAKSSNDKITNRLVEQMGILENLIKGLGQHPNQTDELGILIADLRAIEDTYNEFEFQGTLKEKDSSEEEYSYNDISISEEELKNIKAIIADTRNKIVNNQLQ